MKNQLRDEIVTRIEFLADFTAKKGFAITAEILDIVASCVRLNVEGQLRTLLQAHAEMLAAFSKRLKQAEKEVEKKYAARVKSEVYARRTKSHL